MVIFILVIFIYFILFLFLGNLLTLLLEYLNVKNLKFHINLSHNIKDMKTLIFIKFSIPIIYQTFLNKRIDQKLNIL